MPLTMTEIRYLPDGRWYYPDDFDLLDEINADYTTMHVSDSFNFDDIQDTVKEATESE